MIINNTDTAHYIERSLLAFSTFPFFKLRHTTHLQDVTIQSNCENNNIMINYGC